MNVCVPLLSTFTYVKCITINYRQVLCLKFSLYLIEATISMDVHLYPTFTQETSCITKDCLTLVSALSS